MLTASEALRLGTANLDLDRMLKIAEAKVKEAIKEKRDSCCILFPKHIYSNVDIDYYEDLLYAEFLIKNKKNNE